MDSNFDEKIREYFKLLSAWNGKVSLVSCKSEENFVNLHVNDALRLVPHIRNARRVLDLGAGAGIPGIVLKIAQPKLSIVLVDSTRKKVSFCSEIIRKLELEGIEAVWGRAEDKKIIESLGKFDAVVSRATWKVGDFLKVAEPYLSNYSKAFAMKGPSWESELNSKSGKIDTIGFQLKTKHSYVLQGERERWILAFEHRVKR